MSAKGFGFVQSWVSLIPLRILLGGLEAGCFPSQYYLISSWYSRCMFPLLSLKLVTTDTWHRRSLQTYFSLLPHWRLGLRFGRRVGPWILKDGGSRWLQWMEMDLHHGRHPDMSRWARGLHLYRGFPRPGTQGMGIPHRAGERVHCSTHQP